MVAVQDMQEVEATFLAALNITLSRYLDTSVQLVVQEFIVRMSYNQKPIWLMSPSGVGEIIKVVFENPIHTDFIHTLVFNFMARWGATPDKYKELVAVLATSASTDDNSSINATPSVYGDRLSRYDDVFTTLQNNKWLLIILLIILYVNLGDSNDKKK